MTTLSDEAREQAAQIVLRDEVFENDTTIFYTHEVDPAYAEIVQKMASAMWDHDHRSDEQGLFPTGDTSTDSPYTCRADDALREALPLLRAKIAAEIRGEQLVKSAE